ncbi:MAG TPA: Gfo/Idh/MocA family oxidoreductase [Candidatus Dormibacteraeota bacterium]|nr:Gfo/Idh/MocA family oxidoreductase [Candidatus Dormibacteraeota bacterium]
MSTRKRYAMVGLGDRARMYTGALLGEYCSDGELVALCDVNQSRMRWHNSSFQGAYGRPPVPEYGPQDFERLLDEQRVDAVIVTSVDRTHARYIVAALEHGCDVITEKPLTVDADGCQRIVDAVRAFGGHVTVAFNYRYAPRNSAVRRVLAAGEIGSVLSVHFEWLLDTQHGADYFRRWHRDKRNSGGLMVHKASHHFDLVNWWLGARPETVFGFGKLAFYGRQNAEERGETRFYERAHGSEVAQNDPFALDLSSDPVRRGLYLEAEADDGYLRDRSVFSDGISIEDDMALVVRYSTGATLTYHLTAYSPWEGYRVAFNGDRGRLELEVVERSHVSESRDGEGARETGERLVLQPQWGKARELPIEGATGGGHGGADDRLLEALFGDGDVDDPLRRRSSHVDGVLAILPGIGANVSFASGRPVDLTTLVRL